MARPPVIARSVTDAFPVAITRRRVPCRPAAGRVSGADGGRPTQRDYI